MLPRSYYPDQDIRKRQIDTLKVFNDHVVEITEDSEYRVDFTADGKNMSLNVVLSPEFPNEQPAIFVNPSIPHPWLSETSNQVIGAPGLVNYTQHSDLGRIVQAIIREFQKSLPNLTGTEDKSNESPKSHVSAQSLMFPELSELTVEELHEILENPDLQVRLVNYTQHSDLGRIVQAIIREFQKSLPNLTGTEDKSNESPKSHVSAQSLMFPELSELTVEELHEILENPDLQDKLLETTPHLVELDLETEDLMSSIEEIAQDNLSKQQMLDELKNDVIDRISTIVQMKMNYEELNRKHQRLAEMYDPHRIRDCLKTAALKADEDAEAIAEQFLLGNMPVEAFIATFAEKRALGQARRAREERLAHQLAQLDRATT